MTPETQRAGAGETRRLHLPQNPGGEAAPAPL